MVVHDLSARPRPLSRREAAARADRLDVWLRADDASRVCALDGAARAAVFRPARGARIPDRDVGGPGAVEERSVPLRGTLRHSGRPRPVSRTCDVLLRLRDPGAHGIADADVDASAGVAAV